MHPFRFDQVNFNVSHPSTLSSPKCSLIFSFLFPENKFLYGLEIVRHDSSVGIATRYGLDGPGIECRRGLDFPHPSRPVLGPTQPPIQWVPGLYREVQRTVRCVDHPLPAKAGVKESCTGVLISS
jgi:hypothetical protein